MGATMSIVEVNGASYTPGSTGTAKENAAIAYRANDSSSTDTANPVVRPSASTTQSYEKWLHGRITGGTFGSVAAFRVYVAGASVATGNTIYFRTTNPAAFAQPAVPANNTGGTDATSFTSSASKSLHVQAAGPWTTTGDCGDFLVVWAAVGTTAGSGSMGSCPLVFQWDET